MTIAASLAAAWAAPALAWSEKGADDIPVWCCPKTCVSAEAGDIRASPGEPARYETEAGAGAIPFSENLYVGVSPDDRIHVCVGFDDFGDRHVKCLLTPPKIM